MIQQVHAWWRVVATFRDYKPKRPSIRAFRSWLQQFDEIDRRWLVELVNRVIYLSESQVRRILVQQNEALLAKLAVDGIDFQHVIYVQYHDAASSSSVMLNMLRDSANLEHKGCHFVDGRNGVAVHEKTDEVGSGAVVYVDDFIGSGNQFIEERDQISKSFVGVFPEFLLVPAICEEALDRLVRRGVAWQSEIIHTKAQRPLHNESFIFPDEAKTRLRQVANQQHPRLGLGFRSMATMVVLYRNAPNTVPLLLRGDLGQSPRLGLLPRFQDFPKDGRAPIQS